MSPLDADVERAARVLLSGGLVAFPTETVYGLGADATNPVAVARIFAVKGRPTDHPVIVHLGRSAVLDDWAVVSRPEARVLADAFWPGPLTLVLERGARVPDAVTGGRPTVGLRVPAHPMALALLEALAALGPGAAAIAAPSANRFGMVSPTSPAHVRADLGDDVDLILDGGRSQIGIESTIVDCTGSVPEVLRLGGISVERLAEVLGAPPSIGIDAADGDRPDDDSPGGARAPGMLAAHYAPRARLEVVESATHASRRANELVGRGMIVAILAPQVVDGLEPDVIEVEPLGPPDDYARSLYERLRQADRLGAEVIVAVPPPPGGLGDAVRDRLARASHRPG